MPPERQKLVALLGLLLLLGLVVLYEYGPGATNAPMPSTSAAAGRGGRAPANVATPDVHMQALRDERPGPESPLLRDLFRFKPKAPPPRPVVPARPVVEPSAPSGPPPPPPLAPIPMRFIGLVEAPAQAQKIAMLSDGRGIYQGREGDIIEGRYRILRIGVESIEMAYLDGRGRQTIRLSGS
jgi:hypothetical protein